MRTYCVNKNAQANGDHEVHDVTAKMWCLPEAVNQQNLGYQDDCSAAVRAARAYYSKVNGCAYCAPGCHTS